MIPQNPVTLALCFTCTFTEGCLATRCLFSEVLTNQVPMKSVNRNTLFSENYILASPKFLEDNKVENIRVKLEINISQL